MHSHPPVVCVATPLGLVNASTDPPMPALHLVSPCRKGVLTETVMHTCIKQLLEEVRSSLRSAPSRCGLVATGL